MEWLIWQAIALVRTRASATGEYMPQDDIADWQVDLNTNNKQNRLPPCVGVLSLSSHTLGHHQVDTLQVAVLASSLSGTRSTTAAAA